MGSASKCSAIEPVPGDGEATNRRLSESLSNLKGVGKCNPRVFWKRSQDCEIRTIGVYSESRATSRRATLSGHSEQSVTMEKEAGTRICSIHEICELLQDSKFGAVCFHRENRAL